jgi:membrane protein
MSSDQPEAPAPTKIAALTARIMALKPVRVFLYYGERKGALLAGGLSYQAIFAVFAAIWVTFSAIGLLLASNEVLRNSLIDVISNSVPGLIDDGTGGAIDPQDLFESSVFGWTGAIALAGLLLTALGWLASGRDAVRTIFGIDPLPGAIVVRKLKDFGLALGFGAALLVSAALSVFSTTAVNTVVDWVGLAEDSLVAIVFGRIIGLALVLALDTFVLASFFRFVAGIQIPFRRLASGALIGGVGLGALKVLVTFGLVGGIGSNPLLASFAVIIGLLIWFNLVCQVILISATWIAVGMIDAGIPLDPIAEAARLEREAAERAAARAAEEARRPTGLKRLMFWRRSSDKDDAAVATGSTARLDSSTKDDSKGKNESNGKRKSSSKRDSSSD